MLLNDQDFKRISDVMYVAAGLSFNASKKSLIESRLSRRVERLGLAGFAEYAHMLEDPLQAVEFQMAVDLLTTNETYFFREPKHYELLEQELAARRSQAPLAIWSAAGSFGDEVFSTAMLLSDMQVQGRVGPDWKLVSTDISHRVLLAAKEAVFPVERLRAVSPQQLKRYCLRGEGASEGQVLMQDKLRERVQFARVNLCEPLGDMGPFDVIFLRNVLIYFDTPTKIKVVDRVLSALKPGGLFFMGTAEGRVKCETPLTYLQPGAYRKPEP